MGRVPEHDGTEQGDEPEEVPEEVERRDETLAAVIDRLEDLTARIDKIRSDAARDKRVGAVLSVGGLVFGIIRNWPW